MTSAGDLLSAIADRALEVEVEERSKARTGIATPPSEFHGRVFDRLRRLLLLPPEFQATVDALILYLMDPRVTRVVFSRSTWWHRSAVGPCTKGHQLIAAVKEFLQRSQSPSAARLDAEQLADALVLCGFVAPVKERPSDDDEQSTTTRLVHDAEEYELVFPAWLRVYGTRQRVEESHGGVDVERLKRERKQVSVWAVADGATRAGFVFRKQPPSTLRSWLSAVSSCGLGLGLGRERQDYVVVTRTAAHGSLFIFDSDVAREAASVLDLEDAMVQYDAGTPASPMFHGLKLWADDDSAIEQLDFMSASRQNAWLRAVLDAGATYRETHPRAEALRASHVTLYDLKDVDANGESIELRALRDRVVLVVNVASLDPEAKLQYPELATLAATYLGAGLVVLACPCDQFAELELPTIAEVVAHVQLVYRWSFPVLTKGDVNGPSARELFVFLNARLPGAFGAFTEWNFTKFLIDRRGCPVKRYDTRVLPHEMETDIRRLLREGQQHGDSSEDVGSAELNMVEAPAVVSGSTPRSDKEDDESRRAARDKSE
ncbi:hypothetical protein PINS_up012867 [Pythium insidiosum]|nr:hypothetical protein PINS_up012867 [Pythium insidiosum]